MLLQWFCRCHFKKFLFLFNLMLPWKSNKTAIGHKTHKLGRQSSNDHNCQIIIRLSLLTYHMRELLLFVCFKWLIRPILALNCLLQMEQQRSEQDSSVGDALALVFRCVRPLGFADSFFLIYSLAPLLMRPRHFARSCAICSHDSVGMLKFLREAFRVSLYRFF